VFAISTNIPDIRDKLERIKRLATGTPSWQDDMVNQLKKALKLVKHMTPKSEGRVGSQRGGRHVRSGWKLHVIGKGGKDRVPVMGYIYNDLTHEITINGAMPRESARLMVKRTGTKKDYTLLEVLEYGSPPHKITPVDTEYLKFDANGETVFTKEVDHPGTRPYGMVRVTRAKTKMALKKMMRRWSRKVVDEWKKG